MLQVLKEDKLLKALKEWLTYKEGKIKTINVHGGRGSENDPLQKNIFVIFFNFMWFCISCWIIAVMNKFRPKSVCLYMLTKVE